MEQAASQVIQLVKPGPPAIVQELSPIVAEAKAFIVNDVASHEESLNRERRLRNGARGIREHFAPAVKAAYVAHKEFKASVDRLAGPVDDAALAHSTTNGAFEDEQKRLAADEQRRLQDQARKEEEERQLMDAIDADERGESSEAEEILNEKPEPPQITVAPQVAHVPGVSKRTIWNAKVTDVRECLRFLLDKDEWGPLLEKCISVLESGLRPLAVSQQKALRIPGVEPVPSSSRGVRTSVSGR